MYLNFQRNEKGIAKSAPVYEYPGGTIFLEILEELTTLYDKWRTQMRTNRTKKKEKTKQEPGPPAA